MGKGSGDRTRNKARRDANYLPRMTEEQRDRMKKRRKKGGK